MWDCARNKGVQAEASTLLHESSNSEPETIKQGEIVFHYIRVRVARVGVIPLVGTKPVAINREHTCLLQLHKDMIKWQRVVILPEEIEERTKVS